LIDGTSVIEDQLTIDSATGIITFNSDAKVKTSFEVEIDVVTSDGVNQDVLTVTGIIIGTICGPDSTVLTAPVME
jgi:hypothetical protein